MIGPFLHTEPFRRWLADQDARDNVLLTIAGILLGAAVLL